MTRLVSQTVEHMRMQYARICERIKQLEECNPHAMSLFNKCDLEKLIIERKRLEVIFIIKKQELPK